MIRSKTLLLAILIAAITAPLTASDSGTGIQWGTTTEGKWVLEALNSQVVAVSDDSDDTVRVGNRTLPGDPMGNIFGLPGGRPRDLAVQFTLPPNFAGKRVTAARITLESRYALLRQGEEFSIAAYDPDARIERRARNAAEAINWKIEGNYSIPPDLPAVRLWSSDIAPLVNDYLAQGKNRIGFTIAAAGGSEGADFAVHCSDFSTRPTEAARLVLFEKPSDCVVGRELLGRPTDTGVDFNVIAAAPLDVRVICREKDGAASVSAESSAPDNSYYEPCVVSVSGLKPNRAYQYDVLVRQKGVGSYESFGSGNFRTARPAGTQFQFQIIADDHLQNKLAERDAASLDQYHRTLLAMSKDDADFIINLGDFAHPEFYNCRNAVSAFEAYHRYLEQREFMGLGGLVGSFFLAIGNHDGEQGWYKNGGPDNLCVWASMARKKAILCPIEPGFYKTFHGGDNYTGPRGATYAFTWGDALFVVLDPYFYTNVNPNRGGTIWDWTLGKEQCDWLYEVLSTSDAKWKLVFSHQVTGGVSPYGRGGIEAAKHKVAGLATYEWGGEDKSGKNVFAEKRPLWKHGPVHDMLVNAGVNAFFHGHDHCFWHQELDGITYVECPMPGDARSDIGHCRSGGYKEGTHQPGCGYVRVTIGPREARGEFVRQPMVDEGTEPSVSFSFRIPPGK